MTASLSLTLDDFPTDIYEYAIASGVTLRIIRVAEDIEYNTMGVIVEGYCIELVETDDDDNETHTNQPVVIGVAGSVCTITPVSDTSLNGAVLSDDNISDVTFELSYGE